MNLAVTVIKQCYALYFTLPGHDILHYVLKEPFILIVSPFKKDKYL
jgi:hypothetical protein